MAESTKFHLLLVCAIHLVATTVYGGSVSGQVSVEVTDTDQSKTFLSKDRSGVVVYLTGLNEEPKPRSEKIVIEQKDKKFVPRTLSVTVGERVYFKNADPVLHNVWSLSKTKPFDLGTYKGDTIKYVDFDQPGLVKVFCNIHPQMISSILVLKNNRHMTTGRNGRYELSNLPSGKYDLRFWAEGSKPVVQTIEIKKGQKLTKNVRVKMKLRSKNHLNKLGKPYRDY